MSQKSPAPEQPKQDSLIEHFQKFGKQPLPKGLLVALLVALGISVLSIVLFNIFDGGPKMRHWIESAGAWGPLVYIGLKAATYVIAPLSGTPVKLAGGALFGFWEGAALGLTGDMIGASLNFWIARLFRDKAITKLSGRKAIKQIDELTEHVGGWRALLAARIFLSSLYDFISYAAGLSKLPFKQFFLVSFFAGIPSTLSAAWLGNAAVTNKSFLYILFSISAAGLVALLFMQRNQQK
jgi:uncharacterized membrane protein YdjX (TVP38/TMEM64 family)